MPRSKLQFIAANMIDGVRTAPTVKAWSKHTLPGGLEMIYSKDFDQFRLALRREGVPPSATDVNVCAEVFGVPVDTVPNAYIRQEEQLSTGRKARFHVVELVWREALPAAA